MGRFVEGWINATWPTSGFLVAPNFTNFTLNTNKMSKVNIQGGVHLLVPVTRSREANPSFMVSMSFAIPLHPIRAPSEPDNALELTK